MRTAKIILGIICVLFLYNCKSANRESLLYESITADTTNEFISSSAAVEKNQDTTRRFIRTADLKFKVKSVINSTYDIEYITNRQGGFVTYTNLTSSINNITNVAISADSSLETTFFTVTNTMVLRVPNTQLDTTLKEISKNIDYLDYRIIKAEDVALQILSNNLTQQRTANNQERLTNAIDNRGQKLNETTRAEELLLSKQEQADRARISNLSLNDQINFSTINLTIYQRQSIKRELVSNNKNINEYKPGFGKQILDSIKFGWNILEAVIVFLIKLWGLFLFVLVVYLGYLYYKKWIKKKSGKN